MQFLTILIAFVGITYGLAIGDQDGNMPGNMGPAGNMGPPAGAPFSGGQRPGGNGGFPAGMNNGPAGDAPGNMQGGPGSKPRPGADSQGWASMAAQYFGGGAGNAAGNGAPGGAAGFANLPAGAPAGSPGGMPSGGVPARQAPSAYPTGDY